MGIVCQSGQKLDEPMEKLKELERQQASAEQRQREDLLEGGLGSPVLQQLYASDDEGAQMVTPGDGQGRAEATDSDSSQSVAEIPAGVFAQAREKRNAEQREAEVTHSAFPSPEGFITPLNTPPPGTASSLEASVVQCALQSQGDESPGSLRSVEQEDWGFETSPDVPKVLETVTVRNTQDGRLARTMHALTLKGCPQIYVANASPEDVRVMDLLLGQLSREVAVKCLHSEGDTTTVYVGPPEVTLQFLESKLHPLLIQFLEPAVAVQLVANALDRVWGRIEVTSDRTQSVLITPRVEEFSTSQGDPDMARALVKLVVCSRNLELAPTLRDLLQNALFTTIHDYTIELLDVALKFGVDAALARLPQDALQDRRMVPLSAGQMTVGWPGNANDPAEQEAVAQGAEETHAGTLMRHAAWGALPERERQAVAKQAVEWLYEYEGEPLQPVVAYVSRTANRVMKLVRVDADGTCMAQAVAVVLAGYLDFAGTLLQACGDHLAKHPEMAEMREGNLPPQQLMGQLLSGQEWGTGVELAIMAQLFGVNIRVFAVRQVKKAFETEVVNVDLSGFDDAEEVNIVLYREHYYAFVPADELYVLANGLGTDLTDSSPPLLTASLKGLKPTFRVMVNPQRAAAPNAMERLSAWEQQAGAGYQRLQQLERVDLSKLERVDLSNLQLPTAKRAVVDLTALMQGAGLGAATQKAAGAQKATAQATPISSSSAGSSPATVITISSNESGQIVMAQRQQAQRAANVTPGSAASQTSSMQVIPGTNQKPTAAAAPAAAAARTGARMNLGTMQGGKGTKAAQVCNPRTLYALNRLSQHAEWEKDDFFLKAVRQVNTNGTPLTYRLTVIGVPYILHAAFAALDCYFELHLLTYRQRQQMYFDDKHRYLVSQQVTMQTESNNMRLDGRKLYRASDVLLRMTDLRHEAQLGAPSPAASARGSSDGDHTDEEIDEAPISDGERITPAAVNSGRKVSFATAVSPPEGRSPANSPGRRAPQVKGAQTHVGHDAMVGMRAVGLMATTAALQSKLLSAPKGSAPLMLTPPATPQPPAPQHRRPKAQDLVAQWAPEHAASPEGETEPRAAIVVRAAIAAGAMAAMVAGKNASAPQKQARPTNPKGQVSPLACAAGAHITERGAAEMMAATLELSNRKEGEPLPALAAQDGTSIPEGVQEGPSAGAGETPHALALQGLPTASVGATCTTSALLEAGEPPAALAVRDETAAQNTEAGKPPTAVAVRDGTAARGGRGGRGGVYRVAMQKTPAMQLPWPPLPPGPQQPQHASPMCVPPLPPKPRPEGLDAFGAGPRSREHAQQLTLKGAASVKVVSRDPHQMITHPGVGGGQTLTFRPHPHDGKHQENGYVTGMDEDTFKHMPILCAPSNSALPVAVQQIIIRDETQHVQVGVHKKNLERQMQSALQCEALKCTRTEGLHSSTRVFGVPYTRGWVRAEQCELCGEAREGFPRRECYVRKVGIGAHAAWRLGLAQTKPVRTVMCAACAGGATIDSDAEKNAAFMVWDAEAERYRACTVEEKKAGWQKVDENLRQQWEGQAESWSDIPQFYHFGNKTTSAFYNGETANTATPTPVSQCADEREPEDAEVNEAEHSQKKQRSKSAHKRARRRRKGKGTPPSSDGSHSDSTNSEESRRGGHSHRRKDSETESEDGQAGYPRKRKDSDETHSEDSDNSSEDSLFREQKLASSNHRLKQIAEKAKWNRDINRCLHDAQGTFPKMGPEVNPLQEPHEDGTEAMGRIDQGKKALALNAVREGLVVWEATHEEKLADVHEAAAIQSKHYQGEKVVEWMMTTMLPERSALRKLWAIDVRNGTTKRTRWISGRPTGRWEGESPQANSVVEKVMEWLTKKAFPYTYSRDDAADALEREAHALSAYKQGRTAITTLEGILRVRESLQALGYSEVLTIPLIGRLLYKSLPKEVKTKLDEKVAENERKIHLYGRKHPQVTPWMQRLSKLSSRATLRILQRMAAHADDLRGRVDDQRRPFIPRPNTAGANPAPRMTRSGRAYGVADDDGGEDDDERVYRMSELAEAVRMAMQRQQCSDQTPSAQGSETACALPVGTPGPSAKASWQQQQGRSGRPQFKTNPGQQLRTKQGASFFVANETDIICYNCAKPGHKANACPEPRRSAEERNKVRERLMAVQPREDIHPNSEFLDDPELGNAAWSIDFSSETAINMAIEELGPQTVTACANFQNYARAMQEAATPSSAH